MAIAAQLLQGQTAQAAAKLRDFVAYYKSAPPYSRHWDYSGDREFIKSRAMDSAARDVIVDLTLLLDPRPGSTIENTETIIAALNANATASR